MEYLREFETQVQCEAYMNGSDYEEPFVGLVDATSGISYNKVVPPTPPPSPYHNMYLTFDFKYNDPTTQSGTITGGFDEGLMFYSLDNGETWTDFYGETVTVQNGDKLLLKGNIEQFSSDGSTPGMFFDNTPKFDAYGNTMSLFYGDDFRNKTTFTSDDSNLACLFEYANVVSAENLILPATTLTTYSYKEMFQDCSSLTTAPELPATTLAYGCYQQMFQNCFSLTTAPELPATTLAESCYNQMFIYCTSLTTAPELPNTTLAEYCYYGMFYGCTSLTTAPELPATTLAYGCYYEMFYGCSNLNYIKCLATDISAVCCTDNWVYDVASSGTFVKNPNMTDWPQEEDDYNGIPYYWIVQDAS